MLWAGMRGDLPRGKAGTLWENLIDNGARGATRGHSPAVVEVHEHAGKEKKNNTVVLRFVHVRKDNDACGTRIGEAVTPSYRNVKKPAEIDPGYSILHL